MQKVIEICFMILFSWIAAESMKFIIGSIKDRKIDFGSLIKYGGFPSAHAALVTSLAFSIYLMDGFTISFIIALCLMFIVIRDTITIRRTIDNNSQHLSKISKEAEIKMIAHTNMELLGGVLVGIIIPLVIYLF